MYNGCRPDYQHNNGVLFLCGGLKLCGLLNFFLQKSNRMNGYCKPTGIPALLQYAIILQWAKIVRSAKNFFIEKTFK